ncbi:TrmB family transcriptional regulator [Halopiger aswanensis]|uniref:Sugar-specific transcriptional regulator TrmB n=1 Tax=Halopiger aswanensis TaxID=148449 RepID=A0A3R7GTP4_9EURY|nr:TrmB family transcriptional regulator [Halopiger aswanensis]RKD89188.1 sugar-specific transcriptional regulator TrmB [Halopiger aswanensis]
MDRDPLRDALQDAGLTAYQADAYITLLEQGMMPAVEVAKQCSVPVSQIYDVLRALEGEGYVETFDQDKLHARPKEPIEILSELRSRGKLMNKAADAIEDRWEQPAISEHTVSVVKHEETVVDRARDLIRDAQSFIELSATVDQFRALTNALQDARDRGVVIRVAVYGTDLEARLEDVDLAATVSELRACRIPGPFLLVADRTRTCFTPNDWANRPFGVLIDDYILSFIFHWYFQTGVWELWETVYEDTEPPFPYMTLEEFVRDVAPLWRDGADLAVTIEGTWVETNEPCQITGIVTDIGYPGIYRSDDYPSFEDVAGFLQLEVAADGQLYSIGGWGAVYEDIEAVRITLEVIEFEDPSSGTEIDVDEVLEEDAETDVD